MMSLAISIFYVASDAVKIVSHTNNGVVVANAPDWKVMCYRLDDKAQWTTSLDTFHGLNSQVLNYTERKFEILPKLRAVSTGKDHGINYSCYYDRMDRFAWLADDVKVEPQVADVICRYFSLPAYYSHQIILRFGDLPRKNLETSSQAEGKKKNAWEVSNMVHLEVEHKAQFKMQTLGVKKVDYNAADFGYPKNLRQVKTLTDVLMSKSQKSDG